MSARQRQLIAETVLLPGGAVPAVVAVLPSPLSLAPHTLGGWP